MALSPPRLRLEDGSAWDLRTTPPVVSVPVWQYIRVETGEEVLVGPNLTLSPPKQSVVARVEPGFQIVFTIGQPAS